MRSSALPFLSCCDRIGCAGVYVITTYRAQEPVRARREVGLARRPARVHSVRMAPTIVVVNRKRRAVTADADTPLLWVLRDELGLTGTKFGCGVGVCGACTVLENGRAVRSCQVPLAEAAGKSFTTIEGLSSGCPHRCQNAWRQEALAPSGD